MLDFRAVLSKLLYTFYSSENGFNHDLRVVFYVGFSDFCKNSTDNQLVINKKAVLAGTDYFFMGLFCRCKYTLYSCGAFAGQAPCRSL